MRSVISRHWIRALGLAPVLVLPLRGSTPRLERPWELAAEAAAAVAVTPWTVLRFGTPAAEPFEEHGLDIPDARQGETWAEARRRVEIVLRWPDVRPRVAILDAAVAQGLGPQRARVLLNGRGIGFIDVRPARGRVKINLPSERQKAGDNRLGLIFADSAPPRGAAGHRYAARLYGLVVAPPSGDLELLLEPGAPPFSFWPEARALVQAGPSRLEWAVPRPGGVLHVAPALHRWSRARRARARVRVTASGPAGEQELWEAVLGSETPAAPAWIALPPAASGMPQRLTVSAQPLDGQPVWVEWRDLQVVASQPARPLPALRRHRWPRDVNVVVVVFDAAGARHFGCYGQRRRTTPEVDRLAAEGIVFERAYTPAVFTLSAMASLWTSRLPDEHHRAAAHDDRLPDGVPTLAELLTAHGVRTAGFVGNGMAGSGFGLDRGFDEFAYVGYRAPDFRGVLGPWLKQRSGRRFFLYVHYREPHTPLDPPPPFDTMFGSADPVAPETLDRWMEAVNRRERRPTADELALLHQLYEGNLALADSELGWLRRELEAAGLWDHTAVLVTADHGEALHEHGFIGHNEQVYEESVHIPMVLRLPGGVVPPGRRVATPVGLLDVAPTVTDIFGIRAPDRMGFRGVSLVDVARGAPGRGELLARTAGPRPRYALMDGAMKFVFSSRYGQEELYDLRRDPGEQHDLVASEPLLASVYRQRLHRLLLQLPGRWTGAAAAWHAAPPTPEDLKALGYIR